MRLFRSKDKTRNDSLDSTSSVTSASSLRRRLRKSSILSIASSTTSAADPPRATVATTDEQGLPFRPNRTLVKKNPVTARGNDFVAIDISQSYQRDAQTGEQVIDHTDLLHSLVHSESNEDLNRYNQNATQHESRAVPGRTVVALFPDHVWQQIVAYMSLADRVSLSFSCTAFREQLHSDEVKLNDSEHKSDRQDFLLRLDSQFPHHLFCFNCIKYHTRAQPAGTEIIKPLNVANAIVDCPYNSSPKTRPSRTRMTSGRAFSFPFLQLLIRAHHYSPAHGVSLDHLSRRWTDRETATTWSHQSRYAIVHNHVLMRIISTTFLPQGTLPPAGLRRLLYNPADEFHPYFSTCPHWRDGLLMKIVKCAITHVPAPITGGGIQKVGQQVRAYMHPSTSPIVTLCNECRPIRRCPDCPTEYLVEIKFTEDRAETDPRRRFKQALVITRWSDLGDGAAPSCPEWVACTGGVIGKPLDSLQMNGMGRREVIGDADAGVWSRIADEYGSDGDKDDGDSSDAEWNAIVPSQPPSRKFSTHSEQFVNQGEEMETTDDDNNNNQIQTEESTASGYSKTKTKTKVKEKVEEEEWTGSNYNSLSALGKRAISGVFESQFNVDLIPGQRVLDLNPTKKRKGEAGHDWY